MKSSKYSFEIVLTNYVAQTDSAIFNIIRQIAQNYFVIFETWTKGPQT